MAERIDPLRSGRMEECLMNKYETLPVFNIERFAIHDGPGIRTTVFLQGCALRCQWCANPESHTIAPRLMYLRQKCVGCGQCVAVCPNGAPSLCDGSVRIDRSRCVGCGRCVAGCLGSALRISGSPMSAAEVFEVVRRDKDYYDATGGGLTLSGGEPTLHAEKLGDLIELCREQGIRTAVETCGYTEASKMLMALELFDLFLFDIKTMDHEKFRQLTGGKLEMVLENFTAVAQRDPERIILRIPVLPGFNHTEEDIRAILTFAAGLGVKRADLLPYHTLGLTKYRQMDIPYRFPVQKGLTEDALKPYLKLGRELDMKLSIGG